MTALNSYLSGGTAFIDTWYDQSGNTNNATATTTKRWQLIVDPDDGLPAMVAAGNDCGMFVADHASHKTTKIDLYFVGKIGATQNDSTDYQQVVAGWMPTGNSWEVARWAFIVSEGGFSDGFEAIRNGVDGQRFSEIQPSLIPLGNGKRTEYQVWNYNSERILLRQNDATLWDDVTAGNSSVANITYSGTGKLCLGQSFDGVSNSHGSFRAIVIYGTTRADHAGITSFLKTRWVVTDFPTSFDSSDGWLWTPKYNTSFVSDGSDDANGIRWWYEHGSYRDDGSRGPSFAVASNVNNGATLVRFSVAPGDNDTIVTGAERAERGGTLGASTAIVKGDDFEVYRDIYIEAGSLQDGDWCLTDQIHYDGGNSPDIVYTDLRNNQFQTVTQRNGADTNRGSAAAYSRGTWYSERWSGHWSTNGTSDTLSVWRGAHGTTLAQVVNVSGSLFSTDTSGAYIKEGVYRGFTNQNTGVMAIRVANNKFSKTSGAFSSFVTTQPDLPIHA